MEICACPAPAALTTILKALCKENLGQIQRFIFQRAGFIFDAGDDPTTDIRLLASWTPLFAAVGSTKVVSTPYVENFVIPRTEAATEGGGDNSTIDGIEIIVGANAVRGIGQIAETPSAIIMQIRKLMCEPDLVWYGINQYGAIIAKDLAPAEVDLDAKQYTGLSLRSPFVSDADNNGLNTRDKADFSFGLEYGWRDNIAIVAPSNFNAKTALWPA
jgi:hypothetical protein